MGERVLFFPWGWGGAAGYTGRCLALGAQLAAAGDDIAFADCGVTAMIREAGFPVLASDPEAPLPTTDHRVPPYLPFADVERVFAVAATFYRAERAERRFAADVQMIESYRPTVVVIDMHPTAALAARAAGVPLVSLADADFVTPEPNGWMPWSRVAPRDLLPHPSSLPVWNTLSQRLGLGPVHRAEHLLWGDVTLVCSLPELEPLSGQPHHGELYYVGPLYWNPPGTEAISMPPQNGRPRVYVTIGSGGMVGRQTMQTLLEACADRPWSLFISTGIAFRSELTTPDNAVLAGFTGLDVPLAWADVVVSHGGASTVLASLLHGKPSVIMPFMSEQEMNGRRLVQDLGAGVLLRTSSTLPGGRLAFEDRYSGRSNAPTIPAVDIAAGIDEVLGDPETTRRATFWAARLKERRDSTDLVALTHSAVERRGAAR